MRNFIILFKYKTLKLFINSQSNNSMKQVKNGKQRITRVAIKNFSKIMKRNSLKTKKNIFLVMKTLRKLNRTKKSEIVSDEKTQQINADESTTLTIPLEQIENIQNEVIIPNKKLSKIEIETLVSKIFDSSLRNEAHTPHFINEDASLAY